MMTGLYDPTRHEPLQASAWDDATAARRSGTLPIQPWRITSPAWVGARIRSTTPRRR